MPDDIVLNKAANLKRCIKRIREVYDATDANLYKNLMAQESILLNLQRACEVSIDLAMHSAKTPPRGSPGQPRRIQILHDHAFDKELAGSMKRMVGFRNVAIHEYDVLNLDIVKAIITDRLEEMLKFGQNMIRLEL
jgi:uncharacterized protein YutE (UPF0331/DUF86 family)